MTPSGPACQGVAAVVGASRNMHSVEETAAVDTSGSGGRRKGSLWRSLGHCAGDGGDGEARVSDDEDEAQESDEESDSESFV